MTAEDHRDAADCAFVRAVTALLEARAEWDFASDPDPRYPSSYATEALAWAKANIYDARRHLRAARRIERSTRCEPCRGTGEWRWPNNDSAQACSYCGGSGMARSAVQP